MRKGELLDVQEDRRCCRGYRGSELPGEQTHRQGRLVRIDQFRREMVAESPVAAARQTQKEAQNPST
jgi:hypothetical protein